MKQSILSFIFILLMTGCGTDIDSEKPALKGPLELTINNVTFDYHSEDVEAYITDQNEIRVFITYEELHDSNNPVIGFGLGIIFKENNLAEVMTTFAGDGKNYQTADFIPTTDFHIKNYTYNPTTRDLYFEFEGKLFEKLPTVNPSGGSITLKGKVNQKEIKLYPENKGTQSIAKFSVADNFFYPVTHFSARSEEDYHIFHHTFITNKGERIRFAFDPFILSTPDLPRKYTFDQQTSENRIDFYKFTGFSRSTMAKIMREEDWRKYSCSGTITVVENYHDGAGTISKGSFSIEVYDNQQLYLSTENGTFMIKH